MLRSKSCLVESVSEYESVSQICVQVKIFMNQKSVLFVTVGISLDIGFKFQPDVCIGCQDVLMMYMNLSHIAILNIHGVDYCCIISVISKTEVIKGMQNINLTEKGGTL